MARQQRRLLHDGIVMAAVSVGVSAKRGDGHAVKRQPAALPQVPGAFAEAPSSRARQDPRPPREGAFPSGNPLKAAAWTRPSTARMGNGEAARSSQTGGYRPQPRPFSPRRLYSLARPRPSRPGSSHASSSTGGHLGDPPVYLQSASGWVPAMDSGMTVACWTEVWVATPVSCCQAGGSRIC